MIHFLGEGKLSTFGGPKDTGVGPAEGLALITQDDLAEWWFRRLFLAVQPPGTTGLARRLDPDAFYIAMRWSDHKISQETAARALFRLTNPHKAAPQVFAQGADFGPATRVKRLVDMSPGCADRLGLETDQIVRVEMIL